MEKDLAPEEMLRCQIAVLQEHDEYEAACQQTIKATSKAGRPKKQESEVLSDVTRMKRDRLTTLGDLMDKHQQILKEAEAEALERLGGKMSEDLEAVRKSTEDDVKCSIAGILTCKEAVEKVDVQVVARGGCIVGKKHIPGPLQAGCENVGSQHQ